MKTIRGPAIFLAQFASDTPPFNSIDSIADASSRTAITAGVRRLGGMNAPELSPLAAWAAGCLRGV